MGKYIDLRCDFGFKYCMSDPIIMKSFLNALLEGDVEKITSVTFENVEMPRDTINQRGVTFDLHSTTETGEIFWDRHRKYFINLPKFKFDAENITTKDIWINFFKNLGDMDKIHKSVYERADEGLLRLLEKAKVAALTDKERDIYEASMKLLEDEVDMEEIGYVRGEHDKAIQIATDMKKEGLDLALIVKMTKLSLEEIENL